MKRPKFDPAYSTEHRLSFKVGDQVHYTGEGISRTCTLTQILNDEFFILQIEGSERSVAVRPHEVKHA